MRYLVYWVCGTLFGATVALPNTGFPWLAVRIDVNTYLHQVRHPTDDEVDANVSFMFGLALLFPTDPSPLEMRSLAAR